MNKHGQYIELYQNVEAKTGKEPSALADCPLYNLNTREFQYYEAFAYLSKTRRVGFVPNAISLRDKKQYYKVHGMSAFDDLYFFIDVISQADSHWMNEMNKQIDKNKKQKK